MKSFSTLGFLVVFVSVLFFGSVASAQIAWEKDLTKVLEQAKEQNRYIFLHFYGDHCPPCKKMDAEVFTNPMVIAKIHQHFIPVKISANIQFDLATKYDVKQIPCDIILKPNGEILHRRLGDLSAERYLAYLDFLVAQMPKAIPPVTAPVTSVVLPSPPTLPPLPADLFPANPIVPTPVAVTVQQMIPTPEQSPPSQYEAPVLRSSPTPEIAAQFMPTPPHVEKKQIELTPTEPEPVMMIEVPLAFEGFCPVTLATQERWVPGNPLFYAMYHGQIYRFADETVLESFIKEPAKYAPIADGDDIVLMVARNKKSAGQRKFGAWYQNRVFLFTSQHSLDVFTERPDYYAEIAKKYETALRPLQNTVQR